MTILSPLESTTTFSARILAKNGRIFANRSEFRSGHVANGLENEKKKEEIRGTLQVLARVRAQNAAESSDRQWSQ